jgi:hypothetical protein
MKLAKKKEVVTEEIEVKAGLYYFEDSDVISHKFILKEEEENYTEYILETLHSFSNRIGIIIKEDGAWEAEELPYVFQKFILGISGKKIEKEDFDKEKQEILNKL